MLLGESRSCKLSSTVKKVEKIYIYIYITKKKHYLPHTNPCGKPLSSLFPFLSLSPFATKERKMLLGGTNELIGKVKPQDAGLRLGTLLRGKGDAH